MIQMPGVNAHNATKKKPDTARPKTRAGKLALLTLDDLDKRTQAARRAQAMHDDLVADLGGEESLSVAKRALVDAVSIQTAIIEDGYARWLRDDPGVSLSELTTISNARRRDLQLLGLERVARDITDLDAYFAEGK